MNQEPRYQKGDRIGGRYLVHQALMGGMGEVYLCLDEEEMVPYALKTFQQRYLAQSQNLRRAFEEEVLAWVALEKHPNIVRCFYVRILENRPFMVLEWIAGEEGKGADLRGWLRQGPLALKTALDFAIDICRGLIHAQQKQPGIVHRDLKPENILVAQVGQAKITDFGLAQIVVQADLEVERLLTPEDTATTSPQQSLAAKGGLAGTPPYMPPEQWQPGARLDERTDIYAVGCILYEMLTGRTPFTVDILPTTPESHRRWLSAWQWQHENATRSAVTDITLTLLADLLTVCLARDRMQRPQVVSVLEALLQVYGPLTGQSPRPGPLLAEFTVEDYNNRGITYAILGKYKAALSDFGRAIYLNPRHAETYGNRGNTYKILGQHEAALADYSQLIHLNPLDFKAYTNRGTIYADLGQYEAALADYEQAVYLNPTYAEAYNSRGTTYHNLNQYEAALADFRQAIRLSSAYAEAYNNRGLTYAALGRHEEALTDFEQAIGYNAVDPIIFYNRGNTYVSVGRYEEALADYEQAIRLNPAYAEAYNNRGSTYYTLGKHEAALADYEYAIRLNPEHTSAILNIGALLGNQDKHREAASYFEKATALGDPRGAQYAARAKQRLREFASPAANPIRQAFDVFQQATSPAAMVQVVAQYPFMVDGNEGFMTMVEQVINQQVPPEQRSALMERLTWLRQIAANQQEAT